MGIYVFIILQNRTIVNLSESSRLQAACPFYAFQTNPVFCRHPTRPKAARAPSKPAQPPGRFRRLR